MENVLIFAQQQILYVLAFAIFAFLLFRHESAKGGAKLSCSEVVRAVNSGAAVVLDVREAKEFEGGHLVDAINISHNKLSANLKLLEKHRQKQIIVVDKMGTHSSAAVKVLTENGFDAVRLGGGVTEWQHDSLPLVK